METISELKEQIELLQKIIQQKDEEIIQLLDMINNPSEPS
jgi:hypothetical protein